jgi:hypothetical protein
MQLNLAVTNIFLFKLSYVCQDIFQKRLSAVGVELVQSAKLQDVCFNCNVTAIIRVLRRLYDFEIVGF